MAHLTRHARALVALWSGISDSAHRTQAGRLASAHFAIGALFLAASAPSLETDRRDVVYLTAAVALLTACVLPLLPWERWSRRATLLPVWWAFVLLGLPLGAVAQTLSQTLVFFSMVFVYVGLTQPPRSALLLLPAALLTVTPQLVLDGAARPVVQVVSTIVVAVLLGELLAATVQARRLERRRLQTMLEATRALSAATSEQQVEDVLRGVAAALATGDGAGDADVDRATAQVLVAVSDQARQSLERIAATARLRDAATTDPLTGLDNRRQLFDRLSATGPADTVVLVDLDFFKVVNDTRGHQHGDELLKQFAEALRAVTRDGDCAARYGGEEFVLLLRGTGPDGAVAVVERLRAAWAACDEVTFSAGVAEQVPGTPVTSTLALADDALYRAKRQGRACTVVAQTSGAAGGRGPAVPQARAAEHDHEPA